MMNHKQSGFTLINCLISLSLGLFLLTLLLKLYLWQLRIYHQISDMVFIDHQGVIAIGMLSNSILHAKKIKLAEHSIAVTDRLTTHTYFTKNKKFYLKHAQDNAIEIVSGIEQLKVSLINNQKINMHIYVHAPYGETAVFSKNVFFN